MSCVWDASASWGEQRLLDGTLLLHDRTSLVTGRTKPGPRSAPIVAQSWALRNPTLARLLILPFVFSPTSIR